MNQEHLLAYELVEKEELTDIHSVGYLLRHKKTGARVMVLENDDENKVFDITFRTPPADSTGVAHILEHSVLCGSREFPLKDPFVELVKGSLNTFLNAMTYPDKTTYPVASCNDQDFQNLMHVYLDAVFYPNIYAREEIFRQEGWSYQLEEEEGPLKYNGVVYNEMKGAFSSPDDVLEREIMNTLFPDTTYGCESGGDPDDIPNLTYEAFLDFHRKYYHPSNSYLYLYGNMDAEEKLRFIDEHYLSHFDALEVDSAIPMQKAFDQVRDVTKAYPVSENEDDGDNTYLSYNMVTATAADQKTCMAYEILDYALLSAPGAPLKKVLLDAGMGKDIYGAFEDGILQPYFTVVAKGAKTENKEKFCAIVQETLREIAKKGIDRKALEAGINYFEFRYREADFASYPKGLMYGLDILGTWLYDDENPFRAVQQLRVFEELKKEMETGYFETLIQEGLLENAHGCLLTLIPEKGLTSKKEKELEERLEAYRSKLTKEERLHLVERTKALTAYQEKEEEPGALECIPMLKREDIRREAPGFKNQEYHVEDTLFLYHDVCTNGIAYVDLLFELSHLPSRLIPYVGLLKSVLGYVDTEHYTYGELFNEINANTGGILCGVEVFDQAAQMGEFRGMFGVKGKALYEKLPFLFSMMREILEKSRLDDEKRLYEIIAQLKSRAQSSLVSAGHSTAVLRATSYASPMGWFQDQLGGISFYWFIEDLEKHFEERKASMIGALKETMTYVFRPENLKVSFTGEEEAREAAMKEVRVLKEQLCQEPIEEAYLLSACEVKNEGFKTSGQVQYVAQTGNFRKAGFSYTGALNILKVILSYDYLWMNLRVKGGAYGCMSGFRRNGESFFVSYRDPHLGETLEVYKGIPQYIREFQADEREMTKYIIGTISGKDVPRTPQMVGNLSKTAYFRGLTEEMVQQERDEILDATLTDIQALAEIVEAVLAAGQICVVGSENAIDKKKDLFLTVKHLFS